MVLHAGSADGAAKRTRSFPSPTASSSGAEGATGRPSMHSGACSSAVSGPLLFPNLRRSSGSEPTGGMFAGAALLCVQPVSAIGWLAGGFTVMMTIGLFTMILSRESFTQGVKSLEETNPLAYISPDILKFRHSFQITLPKCAVVLPVKGVRDDSYANWQSQVTSMYGGPLTYIFVVEAEDDPAYPHIERLIREHADANIRLLVAGRTWYCSQKMHNQLHGFEAVLRTAAKYVILLDDDIHLHPGTIRYWVEEMENDPKVVVASGYTFDWVGPSVSGMASYLWMMWRIVASVAFHHPNDRPGFIWGGAMMFRASELKQNVCGLMDAWTDGGYSEDFATLSLARYHGRTNCVPKAALFPSEASEATSNPASTPDL